MHSALKTIAFAALILLGFLAAVLYLAGGTPRLAVEPRTPSEPYAELTARIDRALKDGEPERMARAAAARGDERFLRLWRHDRPPGIDCVLSSPPVREIEITASNPDEMIIIGPPDSVVVPQTAVNYLERYNAALIEAPDYGDADLCVAAKRPNADEDGDDDSDEGEAEAYPQVVYKGVLVELQQFDSVRRVTRPLREKWQSPNARDVFQAARWGQTKAVRHFLRFGARLDGVDKWLMTPLAWAAARGHADTVAALLAAHADPNRASGADGWTPLMFAVLGGNGTIVEALLDHGADATVKAPGNSAPSFALTIAVDAQRPDLVQMLLTHGAKPDVFDSGDRRTPLENAAMRGDLKSMALLLDKGAPIQTAGGRVSALSWAAGGAHLDAVKLLLSRGGEINWTNYAGDNSALDGALEGLSTEIALYLLAQGADPNAGREKRSFGFGANSSLAYAARSRLIDAAKALITAGADIHELQGYWNRETVFEAAGTNDAKMVKLLLSAGANPNARDDSGATPILAALRQREYASYRSLYRGPNGKFGQGAKKGDFSALETLVAHGADVNARDRDGNTALHSVGCQIPALNVLLKLGANPNVANAKGQTPIFELLARDCEDGAVALLEAGASANAKDKRGRTARDYAVHFQRDKVLAWLAAHPK